MTTLLRFRDLKARGIVTSWPMLKLRVERDNFPPGRMVGPNSRAWSEEEIDAWFKSRPIAGPRPPRGAAKANRDRKAENTTTAA
jgi:predicted DNA-binding transcriptional regulator AlpA